eukprot:7647697-Pyramimonas_sp.AAC.1
MHVRTTAESYVRRQRCCWKLGRLLHRAGSEKLARQRVGFAMRTHALDQEDVVDMSRGCFPTARRR